MVHKHHEGHPAVVMVCSPNNPTGNAQDPRIIGAAAELVSDELFIVDEAYIEFGGQTMADLANRFPNVVVVRTFSKAFALAGARIGYCLPRPRWSRTCAASASYHLSALTQAAGLVALRHRDEALAILDAVGSSATGSSASFRGSASRPPLGRELRAVPAARRRGRGVASAPGSRGPGPRLHVRHPRPAGHRRHARGGRPVPVRPRALR